MIVFLYILKCFISSILFYQFSLYTCSFVNRLSIVMLYSKGLIFTGSVITIISVKFPLSLCNTFENEDIFFFKGESNVGQ